MKESRKDIQEKARRRAARVRSKVRGISSRPRLSVDFSNIHIFAQCIDDVANKTLCSISDRVLGKKVSHITVAMATELGRKLSELARQKNISEVVFDRGALRYHGRVKAFADGAREGGLKF